MKQRATKPMARSAPGKGESGFSLVEIMVSLLVGAIVIAGMYQGYNTLHKWLISDSLRSDMRQSARAGLETLTRDIEMAGYQTTSYGDLNKTGLAITLALRHEIEMDQQRIEHTNGSIDWANPVYEPKLVYYHLATDMRTGRQNLYRQIRMQPGLRSTDEIVAENISDFTLEYLDRNNGRVDCLDEIFNNKPYGEYTFGRPRPRVDADYCRAAVAPCTTRVPCNSGLRPDPLKNIRRIQVSLTTIPAGATIIDPSAGTAAGDATITVASTAGFPASGRLDVFFTGSGTNVGSTLVTYSGKDATHFTGCVGVPANASVVARAVAIGRAVKPFTMTASVLPQNLESADEATPDCAPPAVPTGVAVIDTRSCVGKLNVKWNANADLDLAGYKIFYGPTDFVKVPVGKLVDKNNPAFTLNAECLLVTKQPVRSTKPNTYAIQIVAYDASGNDSEKSAAVSGNPSVDVTAFGGAADTTVNPLKPSPPPPDPPVTGPRLTVTHVPGWRFAVSSPPPLADWTPTKLFILPGRPMDVSVLSKSHWGGTWPDCPTYPFASDVYPPASFCPSNVVCCENDKKWSECSEIGDNWPYCPSWLDWPDWSGWPGNGPNDSCWPDYNYYFYQNDAYRNCALCNEPPGVTPKASQVVPADAAQGALVLTWKPADSATAGYRIYRSPEPFSSGEHIDNSLQIAGSTLIDRVSRALYPDDLVPVVPKPTWIDWVDTKLEGCWTYHYAVASVNCDETLVDGYLYNSDPALSDYAYASWTAPAETAPPPPPVLEVSEAGEHRVLITLTNPLSTDADATDFARTEIHWSMSTTASLSAPRIPAIELINGVPGTPGTFEKRGSQVIVFDRETATDPPLSLVAGATYSFLAVSYDHCGNASATATGTVTLPAPAIDSPVGPPLAPTPFPTAPLKACEADRVVLRWAYIDPPEDDFAGFLVTRSKNGGVGVELADGPTTSLSWTDAGEDLPGRKLEAGAEYIYTIAATDRVWEQYFFDPVVPPYLDPLNTLTIGPVHPGGLRRYAAPTGGPEHFTTTLSDGMVAGSPWTYTYHNNVKFWLQNTSRSPVTIKEIAITWQDNKFTREDGKEHIYDIVLDSVVIGGAPSSTAAHTPAIRSADTAKVSTTLKTGVAGVLGKVWYVTFDPALPIVDHATSAGVASGAIPVQLRFTNCDGTVNRDTDMRNGTLGVYLWVDHSFDDVECPTLTNVTIDVPRGPELGCFSQSAPGSQGVASFEVIGRPIKSDRENDLTIPTGNRVDDLKISTGIGVNIHGRKVLDNSREVYPDGVNKGFDVLKVYGVNAAAANPAAVPVMPTPSTFERPLQLVSGDRYALSLSSPPVAGELMPQDANKVHWYFALAVDKSGNWDRVPGPPVPAVPPAPPVLPESNNYAYFQEAFDVCSVTPKAPDQAAATKAGNNVLVTWCAPPAYVNDAPLRADDKISYDVEFSTDGGANWQVVSNPSGTNLVSRSYTHIGLSAGTYIYRVRAKNSCMTCTSCPSSCCGVYAVTSSVVM